MNRISQILNIKHPIVQAPMSWLTDAHLVASVADAGGLGFLAPHAGQTTNPTSNEEVLERMCNEIRKVKALTDKPFGVPVVLDNGWLDPEIYAKLKNAGIKIICR